MRKRETWMDVLRIMACLCVVGIHCNNNFNTFSHSKAWFVSCILNGLYYWSNGVFFMLSGALIIDYRERYSTKQFAINRIKKIYIPFLFWSLVALIIRIISGSFVFVEGENIFKRMINALLHNGCMYGGVFWFVYVLIGLDLFVPAISLIDKHNKVKAFTYIAVPTFVMVSVLPFISNFKGVPSFAELGYPINSGYFLLFIWGYILKNAHVNFIKEKVKVVLCMILGVCAFLMISLGTYFYSMRQNQFAGGFCGWYLLPAFMLCTAVFVLFKKLISI